MHTGMLWFDNSNTNLEIKLQKAIEYYTKKHGKPPTLILIHPSMFDQQKTEVNKITIRTYRPVLPGHIWLGIDDEK